MDDTLGDFSCVAREVNSRSKESSHDTDSGKANFIEFIRIVQWEAVALATKTDFHAFDKCDLS